MMNILLMAAISVPVFAVMFAAGYFVGMAQSLERLAMREQDAEPQLVTITLFETLPDNECWIATDDGALYMMDVLDDHQQGRCSVQPVQDNDAPISDIWRNALDDIDIEDGE